MSQRLSRINELLKREISSVIQREFEFNGSLVTISDVDVTQDLKEAKVFVSVLGGSPSFVLSKLNDKHGIIQNRVAKRVVLKQTPVLSFRTDESAARGVDVVNLLDEVAKIPTAPPEEEDEV